MIIPRKIHSNKIYYDMFVIMEELLIDEWRTHESNETARIYRHIHDIIVPLRRSIIQRDYRMSNYVLTDKYS